MQYLDEFISIRNNVSSSISEVRDDVEQTVEQMRRRFQDCTTQYLKVSLAFAGFEAGDRTSSGFRVVYCICTRQNKYGKFYGK